MELIIIVVFILLSLMLLFIFKLYADLDAYKRRLKSREETISQLENKPVEQPKSTVDILMEELMKQSDEDEVKMLIDMRKAWKWNGQKGDVNE